MTKRFVGFSLSLTLFMMSSFAQAQVALNQLLSDKLYLHVKMEPTQKIIEIEPLKKLYELNNFKSFWIENSKPNQAAEILRGILAKADDWGLESSQYLNKEILNLFDHVMDKNSITLEILLSDAYLHFATDLANGLVLDPDLIDEDIKMPRKSQDFIKSLAEGAREPQTLESVLLALTPQHEKYQNLTKVLRRLNALKAQKAWVELVDPNVDLRPGNSHKIIPEVKRRLMDLGYQVTNQTNVYDTELQKAVARYQELNLLPASRTLTRNFFHSIVPGLQARIDKIKVNMEKFRWFPRQWESRHLMVNMAFQEMRVVEQGQTALSMRTVNGRPTRRTPTMRDEIRFVELNPTWTVPFSIAIKDKLPMLQENPMALQPMKISVFDKNGNELDPIRIDWANYNQTNFDFTFVQQPGSQNALGLVKFPLTNPWFIYLHDTNEPWLMKESERLRSSGCIRLEHAFDLAQYLLRDQPEWSVDQMKAQTQGQFRIRVKQPLPVYFMYLTADVTTEGEIRMASDEYGQDQRLIELFKSRGSREKF